MTSESAIYSGWPVHPAAELFPLLPATELTELAEDIKANGLHEPVTLWNETGVCLWLLDGRNRARACEIAGIQPTTRFYSGDDPIGFSISANVKRRHLTAGQRAILALDVEKLYAAEAKRRETLRKIGATESETTEADLPQSSARAPQSRDRAAKATKASGRAVSQAKRVALKAPDLAAKVKAGDMAIDRAERIIRDREAEQRRVEQARAEAAAAEVKTTWDVRHGDFREVLADLSDVDAIITDPPYPREYLPLLADLAAWADKVLAPDGVLAVLLGQTHLEEAYRLLSGHRPYRWTACYLTEGAGYVSHPRKVQSNWKPLVLYGNGPRFSDVIRSTGVNADAKNNHKWGQDYQAFHTIIERLTTRGQTVADPFAGSGTTLLAARALGRHAVGADTNPAAVAKALERLG